MPCSLENVEIILFLHWHICMNIENEIGLIYHAQPLIIQR